MKRSTASILGVVLVLGTLLVTGLAAADGAQIVYESDFSTAPLDWMTNDFTGGNHYRGSPDFDLHLEHVNESGYSAYTEVSASWDETFRLEFDIRVNNAEEGGGTQFGLFDPDMRYDVVDPSAGSSLATVDFAQLGSTESTKSVSFQWIGSDGVKRVASDAFDWVDSTWYHSVLEFLPGAGTARLIVSDGKAAGGDEKVNVFVSNLFGDALLAPNVSRLGTSGIGDYEVSAASANYEVDNIFLTAVPAPSTLVGLLSLGVAGLLLVCRRRFRKV